MLLARSHFLFSLRVVQYSKDLARCSWLIQPREGTPTITFASVSLGDGDVLSVYDGATDDAAELAVIRGREMPLPVTASTASGLLVVFEAGGSGGGDGFEASYSTGITSAGADGVPLLSLDSEPGVPVRLTHGLGRAVLTEQHLTAIGDGNQNGQYTYVIDPNSRAGQPTVEAVIMWASTGSDVGHVTIAAGTPRTLGPIDVVWQEPGAYLAKSSSLPITVQVARPGSSGTTFKVLGGKCKTALGGRCVTSPNYPHSYGGADDCFWTAPSNSKLHVVMSDLLQATNTRYGGTYYGRIWSDGGFTTSKGNLEGSAPEIGMAFHPDCVNTNEYSDRSCAYSGCSDNKGFMLCAAPSPPKSDRSCKFAFVLLAPAEPKCGSKMGASRGGLIPAATCMV